MTLVGLLEGGSEVRTTTFTHDALGHVLITTVGAGPQARVTEYRFEHPTYQRTLTRRALDGGWVTTTTQYGATGNPEMTTDAFGRTVTRTFDARDRLTR